MELETWRALKRMLDSSGQAPAGGDGGHGSAADESFNSVCDGEEIDMEWMRGGDLDGDGLLTLDEVQVMRGPRSDETLKAGGVLRNAEPLMEAARRSTNLFVRSGDRREMVTPTQVVWWVAGGAVGRPDQ